MSRWDFLYTLAANLIQPEIERRRENVAGPSASPASDAPIPRERQNCAVRTGCRDNKAMERCSKCPRAMCGRCQAKICTDCAE